MYNILYEIVACIVFLYLNSAISIKNISAKVYVIRNARPISFGVDEINTGENVRNWALQTVISFARRNYYCGYYTGDVAICQDAKYVGALAQYIGPLQRHIHCRGPMYCAQVLIP
jgi:hypothetical protein